MSNEIKIGNTVTLACAFQLLSHVVTGLRKEGTFGDVDKQFVEDAASASFTTYAERLNVPHTGEL